MNIKDVKAIHEDVSFIKNRENIYELVELPCLEACLMLYDKNIATTSSSANGEGTILPNRAEIVIVYDMLSDENKKIADQLKKEGNLIGQKGSSGRDDDDCVLVVSISDNSTVEEISNKFVDICSRFEYQDLMYGSRSKEQFVKMWEKQGVIFDGEQDLIDTIEYFGLVYDDKEELIWDSEELLEKHKKFINEKLNEEDEFDFDVLLMKHFFEKTPEEIEEKRQERAKVLEEKGFLPENEDFSETMTSLQEDVENNPTKYIISECLPACQELWSKNIYTFMASNHMNEDMCWIEIIEDALSEENKKIYMELSEDEVIKFSFHAGTVNFGVNCVGKEGQKKLLELAQKFKMQDVPCNLAYISPHEFLMNYCGCYEEYPNPDYRPMTPPWAIDIGGDEIEEYEKRYEQWQKSYEGKKTLKRFAPEKVTKSILEYANELGMVVDYERIYLSQFHFNKHQNYINYINEMEPQGTNDSLKKF